MARVLDRRFGRALATYLLPIVGVICVILGLVAWSYRQTIAAYPGNAAGSFIVVGKNLGERWAALAATALAIDYVLNVAVGISAGIGAITSAVPARLSHTLALCLIVLAAIAFANLRGIRQSGTVFAVPTFAFLIALGSIIALGVVRAIASGGAPHPASPPPAIVLPAIWIALVRIRRNNRRLDERLSAPRRIALPDPRRPIAIVAAGSWNRLAREGIAVVLAITDEVHVVQIRTEHDAGRGLSSSSCSSAAPSASS